MGIGEICPDLQGRYHLGMGKSQDYSFLLGDITRKKGEVGMVQSPSQQISLGKRGKESGWYNPLLEATIGRRGGKVGSLLGDTTGEEGGGVRVVQSPFDVLELVSRRVESP